MKLNLLFLLAVLCSLGSGDETHDLDMWTSGVSGSAAVIGPDNLTLTCAAEHTREITASPYSESFSTAMRALQSIFYILVITAGTILNILVIVLVAKHMKLQTVSLMATLQIVVANLLLSPVFLLGLVGTLANQWVFGEHMCAIVGFFIFVMSMVRVLLMLVFAICQFLSVFCTYCYLTHKAKINIALSAMAWLVLAVAATALTPPLLDCYTFAEGTFLCGQFSMCSHSCFIFLSIFDVGMALAVIVTCVLYSVLYYKAWKISNALNVTTADGAAELELRQREWKTTVTYVLLLLTIVLLTVPSLVIIGSIDSAYSGTAPPPALFVLSVISGHAITFFVISDPIVIMCNAEMREVISEIKDYVRKSCPHCLLESDVQE